MNAALPQEMQQHTYAIMDEVEDSHWWFVGRRAILESFLRRIAESFESRLQAADADAGPAEVGTQNTIRILDIGCGTGANIEMLARALVPALLGLGAHLQHQGNRDAFRLIPILEWLESNRYGNLITPQLLQNLSRAQRENVSPATYL